MVAKDYPTFHLYVGIFDVKYSDVEVFISKKLVDINFLKCYKRRCDTLPEYPTKHEITFFCNDKICQNRNMYVLHLKYA